MVHPYLKRRQGREAIERISDKVDAVLARTYGVPIFQEQVMQLAIVAADFTPGEADQLRRAMAAWRRKGNLQKYQDKLRAGMRKTACRRICRADRPADPGIWRIRLSRITRCQFRIAGYASAWVKRHHPDIFLCGLLNSQPMGFYSPSMLVQDARRHGVTVLPPDAAASDRESTLAAAGIVRLGLREIKGLAGMPPSGLRPPAVRPLCRCCRPGRPGRAGAS
jgi:error-prone DNA polymerase